MRRTEGLVLSSVRVKCNNNIYWTTLVLHLSLVTGVNFIILMIIIIIIIAEQFNFY